MRLLPYASDSFRSMWRWLRQAGGIGTVRFRYEPRMQPQRSTSLWPLEADRPSWAEGSCVYGGGRCQSFLPWSTPMVGQGEVPCRSARLANPIWIKEYTVCVASIETAPDGAILASTLGESGLLHGRRTPGVSHSVYFLRRYDAQAIPSRFVHLKRCEETDGIEPDRRSAQSAIKSLENSRRLIRDGTTHVPIGCSRRTVWMRLESSMEILTWVIVAIGVLVGGPIMMFGFRNSDQKPVAFGQIGGALKQDWTRTGNIDFHAVAFESSSPQPLRLRVEEKRVTESAAGQDVVELRWRLATLQEGKELVVCWNARQTGLHYSTNPCSETTALVRAGSTAAAPSVPNGPKAAK